MINTRISIGSILLPAMKPTLISSVVLLLLVAFATPPTANSQGLVEYALILVVTGIGPSERAVIQWIPGSPANANSGHALPGDQIIFTITVTNSGSSAGDYCQQTLVAPVSVVPGMNTLNVSKTGALLFVNGEEAQEPLVDCLAFAERIGLAVGSLFPPPVARELGKSSTAEDQEDRNVPIAHQVGLPNILHNAVVASDGRTVASSASCLPLCGRVFPKIEVEL